MGNEETGVKPLAEDHTIVRAHVVSQLQHIGLLGACVNIESVSRIHCFQRTLELQEGDSELLGRILTLLGPGLGAKNKAEQNWTTFPEHAW